MKRILIRLVVFLLLVGLGWAVWYGSARWNASRAEHCETLTLYGNVEIHQVDLAFRVAGRIEDMFKNEGDTVRPGDTLARLDARPYQDEVRRAEANLAMQEATLAKLEAGYRPEEIGQALAALEEGRAAEDNARRNYERVRKLRTGGGVSQQNLEDARAAWQAAAARLDAAQKQYDLVKSGFRVEDITAQKAAVEAALAALDTARTALADTVLIAPEGGVTLTKARERGAVVQAGQTVYTVSLTQPVYIRAFVPQPDLGLIRPGAAVRVAVDAVPGKTYPGRVGFVSPTAEFTPKSVETREVRNDLVFRIRILADDPDNVLRQGMPVTITLEPAPAGDGAS